MTGTIRLNGEPAGPGTITFEQANPESMMAPSAAALFGADGRYTLRSPGNKPGAPAGEYVVRIQGHSEDWTGDESFDAEISTSVPAKYNDPRASGLTATIEPGNQTINFDLEP